MDGHYIRKLFATLGVAVVVCASSGATSSPVTGPLVAHAASLTPVAVPVAPVEPIVITEYRYAPKPAQNAPQRATGGGGCTLEYIRKHEASGNYSTNTGNGYYGAYQYKDSTWNGYGGYQHASDAPPSVQDERASKDLAAGKQSQWSVC